MAQNPNEHAQAYGLSRDVAGDLEPEEGPPSQGHHGETRTRLREHVGGLDHGPKTRRKIKETINRGSEGGTH